MAADLTRRDFLKMAGASGAACLALRIPFYLRSPEPIGWFHVPTKVVPDRKHLEFIRLYLPLVKR